MDVAGKTVVVKGKFDGLTRAEIAEGLAARGAKVEASVTTSTDLIFSTLRHRRDFGGTHGVPIFDEAALLWLLRDASEPDPPKDWEFADHTTLLLSGPKILRGVLAGADWDAFSPERDLPVLRAALADREAVHGVTDVHREATARVLARGATLLHPDAHTSEIGEVALSPDGRHLAVVSDGGGAGGGGFTVQIWEVETARPVAVMSPFTVIPTPNEWGRAVQWSADSSRLAIAHDTGEIGVWAPFADFKLHALAEFSHGAGGPLAYALAPDGHRAYVAAGNERPGCVVPFEKGRLLWNPAAARDAYGPAPARVPGDPDPASWTASWTAWTGDGRWILSAAIGEYGPAISVIDAATGETAWTDHLAHIDTYSGAPVSLSADGRFLAYLDEKVHLAESTDRGMVRGEPIEQPSHASAVAVTCHEDGARVAVLAPDGVLVVDGGDRHHVDAAPRSLDSRVRGVSTWAWSPDGVLAACLTDDGVEIWSFHDGPRRVRVLEAAPDAQGVLWGAGGEVIVTVAPTALRFTHGRSGEILGDVVFGREPSAPRPLLSAGGRDLDEDFMVSQTFALDDDTWAVAFDTEGLVIAPEGRLADLDALLAWSIGGRHAWPVRWGPLTVLPDARAAHEYTVRRRNLRGLRRHLDRLF